ncbi:hypothetical protein Fot_34979 [Forsythia ovata]|uniref:Uncharacterized protein n=1 Tax=Forsythia ovata TaxID=205694 RepID=A0ABD1SKA4_9LAMI
MMVSQRVTVDHAKGSSRPTAPKDCRPLPMEQSTDCSQVAVDRLWVSGRLLPKEQSVGAVDRLLPKSNRPLLGGRSTAPMGQSTAPRRAVDHPPREQLADCFQ